MCTLSWTPLPGGYALAMNRDERRTRAPALPPAPELVGGVPALMPVDGDAGGTWISVNDRGHALELLNRWDESPHDAGTPLVSRGLLVRDLAGLPGAASVGIALAGLPLAQYRPFTLVSVTPGRPPTLFEWNGLELSQNIVTEPGLVRTSSGSDQAGVERSRGALLRAAREAPGGLTPELLTALHRSHRPERGPLSICMHRPEAVTVSFSLITVSASQVLFRYVSGSPCETEHFTESSLPLRLSV
ncbi:MAG TPA: NRDE family protein [Gemmatimonadales bacterium]|nr:NRDE family protein [Gemmatimonadales bacterium]